jgi:hypothetical protein
VSTAWGSWTKAGRGIGGMRTSSMHSIVSFYINHAMMQKKLSWKKTEKSDSFNYAAKCYDYTAPNYVNWMQLWTIGGIVQTGNNRSTWRRVYQCHLPYHKSHMHWSGIKPDHLRMRGTRLIICTVEGRCRVADSRNQTLKIMLSTASDVNSYREQVWTAFL